MEKLFHVFGSKTNKKKTQKVPFFYSSPFSTSPFAFLHLNWFFFTYFITEMIAKKADHWMEYALESASARSICWRPFLISISPFWAVRPVKPPTFLLNTFLFLSLTHLFYSSYLTIFCMGHFSLFFAKASCCPSHAPQPLLQPSLLVIHHAPRPLKVLSLNSRAWEPSRAVRRFVIKRTLFLALASNLLLSRNLRISTIV